MPILTAEERIGSVLAGRYRIESVLGEGGMGVVFGGKHELTGRSVAIKLLQPYLVSDVEVLGRFFQEAKAAAALNHPNVVDVLDMGVDDGSAYLALELLDGEPLTDILEKARAIAPADLLAILLPVIDALAAAHERGILHRDLKPDNIFVSRDLRGRPTPKVLDFGIAKLIEGDSAVETKTGGLIGTPHYMSPEQAQGKRDIGPSTDIWSMGVVLYECLTGQRPFAADSIPALLMQICTMDPTPLPERNPLVPAAIAEVVHRAMERDLGGRYTTMEELGAALLEASRQSGLTLSHATEDLFGGFTKTQAGAPTPLPGVLPASPETPVTLPATTPAATSAPPKRSALGIALGAVAGAVLLAGLVGGGIWALRAEPPPTPAIEAPIPPEPDPRLAETPAVEAPIVEAPVVEAPVVVAPRVLRSEPDHAEVWRGDVSLGRTPLEVTPPAAGALALELRAPGRRPTEIHLDKDSPLEVSVSLPRRRSAERPSGAAAPTLAPR